MLFFSDDPQQTGPKVEAKLRRELKLGAPIPYTVMVEGKYLPGSLGQAAGDVISKVLTEIGVGGGVRLLHTLRFDVAGPRPFELDVEIVKAQAVCVGGLLYTTTIARGLAGAVKLEDEKAFGRSKLVGDAAAAAKLNASKPLVKAVNALARDRYEVGATEIIARRHAALTPLDGASLLLSVLTMPRSKLLNLSSTFDAPAFLELAALVEAALG
jgi:hypothetical protein